MSNKRIDLTQFEDVKGPWEYNTDDDGWTLATIHERDNPDRDEFIVLMRKPNGDPLLTMNPNLSAITMVPNLIAELKRCYEELDSQHKMISELIEANTVKGEILDALRICDECGEKWDYHNSGADCEADRQRASE